jgi:hypothetical protein
LPPLLETIQLLGLLVGFLLALHAGRSLAMKSHDAELARRHGRRLPAGLGLAFYLLVLASLIVNILVLATTQALSLAAKALLGAATGNTSTIITSLLDTATGLATGYLVFSHRYRGIDSPLTREGRIALRGIELGTKTTEKLEAAKKLPSGLKQRLQDTALHHLPGKEDTSDKTREGRDRGSAESPTGGM